MDQLRYIAVEGPIGVGKSSLVELLAKDMGARAVFESPDENPFLPYFYQDRTKFAFQTQLYFLLSRYRQQLEIRQQDMFSEKVVCDYIFAKDQIFAGMTLTEDELALYRMIFQLLDQRLPKPDAVIFLQADVSVLYKRLRKRGKEYERSIEEEYLQHVAQAYSQYFFQFNACPLLVVNTSGLDFVESEQDYEQLKKELFFLLKSGKEKHYVTIDHR